jgi:hypothetical protein
LGNGSLHVHNDLHNARIDSLDAPWGIGYKADAIAQIDREAAAVKDGRILGEFELDGEFAHRGTKGFQGRTS